MTNKLRVIDSKILASRYNELSQIFSKITEAVEAVGVDSVEKLPPSLVPTSLLYGIAICYTTMYDLLVDKELVSAGYLKTNNTIH